MKRKVLKNILLFAISFILIMMTLPTEFTVFAASETPLEIIKETAEVLEEMDNSLDSGMFRSVLK